MPELFAQTLCVRYSFRIENPVRREIWPGVETLFYSFRQKARMEKKSKNVGFLLCRFGPLSNNCPSSLRILRIRRIFWIPGIPDSWERERSEKVANSAVFSATTKIFATIKKAKPFGRRGGDTKIFHVINPVYTPYPHFLCSFLFARRTFLPLPLSRIIYSEELHFMAAARTLLFFCVSNAFSTYGAMACVQNLIGIPPFCLLPKFVGGPNAVIGTFSGK